MAKKDDFVARLAPELVKLQVFSPAEADSLIKEFSGRAKGRVDEFLLDDGVIDHELLLKAFRAMYNVPSFDVRGYFFNHQILLLFPKDFLINNAVVPLDVDDDMITVVVANPEDEKIIEALGDYVAYTVSLMVGVQRDIIDAIEQYYDEDIITSETHEQEQDVCEDEEGAQDCDIVDLK